MVTTTNNIENNTLHKLSIQVSLNGLSFCTLNNDGAIVDYHYDNFGIQLSPEQVLDKVKNELNRNSKLAYSFEEVEVIHQNDLYTFVPKALFDEHHLQDYLKYSIKLLETDFIDYDEIEQLDMVCVYVPYTNLNNYFFETFGSFTYTHVLTSFLNQITLYNKNLKEKVIYVNLHSRSVDIIAMVDNKVVLTNSHRHENREDFMYYILFTAEQLNFNPEDFRLSLFGQIDKNDSYYEIAYKYIRNISLGGILPSQEILNNGDDFKTHKFLTLLS